MEKCVGFAICGGSCTSAASNVVAFANHFASRKGIQYDNFVNAGLFAANVVLNLGSIAFFLLAAANGPVAVAMPILTGTKLLSSLVFQMGVGIGQYTKDTKIGTYVLVAASLCLIDVGPSDPSETQNVADLLSTTTAECWLACLVSILFASLAYSHQIEERGESAGKAMLLLCVMVAISTALGASMGKLLSITSGLGFVATVCAYLSCGAISFIYAAIASFHYDMEVFMPLSEVLQLIVNCLTGILVWGDGPRVRGPIAYTMVYLLFCLGVYLCVDVNVVGHMEAETEVHQAARQKGLKYLKNMTSLKVLGQHPSSNTLKYHVKVAGDLRRQIESIAEGKPPRQDDSDFRTCLKQSRVGKDLNTLQQLCADLAELCKSLFKDLHDGQHGQARNRNNEMLQKIASGVLGDNQTPLLQDSDQGKAIRRMSVSDLLSKRYQPVSMVTSESRPTYEDRAARQVPRKTTKDFEWQGAPKMDA